MPRLQTDYSQDQIGEVASPSDDHSHHDDDSITDVGDSLMGNSHHHHEKGWNAEDEVAIPPRNSHKSNRSRRRRWCCSATVWQGLLNTFLLLVVLALLFDRQRRSVDAVYEGAGDVTGVIPPVAQKIQSFVPDWEFSPENGSEFFADAVQKKWLEIVPKGLGFIQVQDPSKHNNLPHRLKGYASNMTVFTTSVTHQLHCLYNIIEVFSSLTSGTDIEPQMAGHLPHCFEYLRQSILCCGDTALEGQHTTFPDGTTGSDGWDALHVCKDYGAIYSWLEEHRADDQEWI